MRPVIGGRLAGLGRVGFRGDDHLDGQVERPGEVQVALIVRGHRHDRAGAVVGQHVVRGVHRDLLAVDGVDRVAVQEDAGLRPVGGQAVDDGAGDAAGGADGRHGAIDDGVEGGEVGDGAVGQVAEAPTAHAVTVAGTQRHGHERIARAAARRCRRWPHVPSEQARPRPRADDAVDHKARRALVASHCGIGDAVELAVHAEAERGLQAVDEYATVALADGG